MSVPRRTTAAARLARMPHDGELTDALRADPGLRDRLIAVLGASRALGDHLARHPGHWRGEDHNARSSHRAAPGGSQARQ